MNRLDITEKIISTKVSKGIKWSDVADKVGLSKEWVTAACLGQMTLDAKQATLRQHEKRRPDPGGKWEDKGSRAPVMTEYG